MDENETTFDRLLAKYNALWLWSIEFGALSGTVFSLLTYTSIYDNRWGTLTILFAMFLALGTVTALLSGVYLYRCLTMYLLPKLLTNSFRGKEEEKEIYLFGLNLRRAFVFMMLAIASRLFMSIAELIIHGLGY